MILEAGIFVGTTVDSSTVGGSWAPVAAPATEGAPITPVIVERFITFS